MPSQSSECSRTTPFGDHTSGSAPETRLDTLATFRQSGLTVRKQRGDSNTTRDDGGIDRRALLGAGLAAGGIGAAEMLLPHAAAAASTPAGPRVVVTNLTSEDINAAIAGLPSSGGVIELVDATYTIDETVLVPSNVAVIGKGRGVTILQLAPGANTLVVGNADLVNGNANITLRGFTVDGNGALQPAGASTQGIELHQCPGAHLDDLDIHDCTGTGVYLSGDGAVIRIATLSNIQCRHNAADGMFVTAAAREVHYTAVTCDLNGRDGLVIDHSESIATGIHARGNVRDGVRIHNVVTDTIVGINANLNGRNGIRVSGFVDSSGAAWNAHGNGLLEPASDVYFDGLTDTYGLTNRCIVSGIECCTMSKSTWGVGYPLTTTPTSTYSLEIDPAITGAVTVLGVRTTGGTLGPFSLPPVSPTSQLTVLAAGTTTGDLQVLRGNLTITTGNFVHGGKTAKVGFYGATPTTRPTVTGSLSKGTAMQSLLSALAKLGLINNTTTK